jgi:hypothetical protein
MTLVSEVVSKPLSQILLKLTNQKSIDLALAVLVQDHIRLRLKEVGEARRAFEQKYSMTFEEFKEKWQAGLLPDRYAYEVEKDYWEWEGAVTNETSLRELRAAFP